MLDNISERSLIDSKQCESLPFEPRTVTAVAFHKTLTGNEMVARFPPATRIVSHFSTRVRRDCTYSFVRSIIIDVLSRLVSKI